MSNLHRKHIYTYSCYEEEQSLCALEMRTLFGVEPAAGIVESCIKIDPSRSPFMKERISVLYEADSLQHLLIQLADLQVSETYKVLFVKSRYSSKTEKVGFEDRRKMEREIGLHINGVADLRQPQRIFAVIVVNGRWMFGDYVEGEPIWFQHQQKPHSYSTALNTRVARAIVNIAIPDPSGVKAIDPCCGIGTVLVEALSMGIDIVGSDRNPLVLGGARENIAHFRFSGEVKLADIRDITSEYDVAMIDLPYNLCSVITLEEKTEMLLSARRFAKKVLVVTVEPIDDILKHTGFIIVDRAVVKKGSFTREVIVCE
ncbi:TRM11 family methyltransferase [Bacillus sp. S/N-304-OC-R1]|uniref:TRM11 family SAM-dependent methyltransferase n=1 Tax=Bacillus sp. S/N-304-OC-R1 TaxID=2758034 RepID=UPI001C8E8A67|nr:RsmD family RNA methyltransferase [Bacillus sp. S/N-304-OC-R1]MBY0123549.1 RsmD family RNA methyltransferase [Bacillus sp. S/N-304-OC-R1]